MVLDRLLDILGPLTSDAGQIGLCEIAVALRPLRLETVAYVESERLPMVIDGLIDILGTVPANALVICNTQIVLTGRPAFRIVIACRDLECARKAPYRQFQILGPVALRAQSIRAPEIGACHGPITGQALARPHQQRLLEMVDRVLDIVPALPHDAVRKGDAEIVLALGPVDRVDFAPAELERGSMALY